MLLPAKREALRICKRSYPIMENLMAPRTPVLFFSGLIRFLDRMACHHALDETGGGSAKKTPEETTVVPRATFASNSKIA